MKQERWRSTVLWGALASQIMSILVLVGVIDITQSETINTVIGLSFQILTTIGVLNNPSSKEEW
jgi:uncharacterized membrane protein